MQVLIVESAAKAKAINKYLGNGYKVFASYGHIRDLPAKDGSVDPDADFEMTWDADAKSKKILNEIASAVQGADKLILATDPDREGEAISWHIMEVLEKKRALKGIAVERVAFNAVTKQAVIEALKHPREIDQPLVSAYLARRALDYLVGFTLSPVLWRKLPGARSAGRVQSVALRLVCDREEEIEAFKPQEYWNIEGLLKTAGGADVTARLYSRDGKRLDRFDVADEATAHAIRDAITGKTFTVSKAEQKPVKRHPSPPFTTSTLQQEASRKLGFSASRTMQVAQKLYEGIELGGDIVGLITYMRTDGVQMVDEALTSVRRVIGSDYGDQYVPPSARIYKAKAKNAQEAHEAVRPTDFRRHPDEMARHLDSDGAKLYRLIWQRAVASQMESAILQRTTIDLTTPGSDGKTYGLRAVGTVVTFDGFLKLYEEGKDDTKDDDDRRLPAMSEGDKLAATKISATQHFTEPPPRFSEATLVKRMEELGIGRPSTYASTMATLRDREYVRIDGKRIFPEDKGRLVTGFLKSFFKRYVEYDFTADLEGRLDLISDGQLEWKTVLRTFWTEFAEAVNETKDLRVTQVLDTLNELMGPYVFPPRADGTNPRSCPVCENGQLSLKVGRFGAFVGCSNHPECRFTRQFSETDDEGAESAKVDGKVLGQDPETGMDVTVRLGRFGPYLQIGEPEGKEKPKRSSIPKGYEPGEIDFETAMKFLSLPRHVGDHPETGKPIVAGFGRFGPFVESSRIYANLDGPDEVFTVGLNRAVALIAEKAESRARRGGTVLKDLGEHPAGGGNVEIMEGRYGPYVKWKKINATLPKDTDAQSVTMEQAIALIEERAAKTGKKAPAKKTAAKKPAAKKATTAKTGAAKATTTRKAPAKKPAAKKTTAAKASSTKSTAAE